MSSTLQVSWELAKEAPFLVQEFGVSIKLQCLFLSLLCTFILLCNKNYDVTILDLFRSSEPYFMKINGITSITQATTPRTEVAGPTPIPYNMGLATSGKPAAMMLRRNVFEETALAA